MSKNRTIFLQRTLHPVGQGGFYTERIYYRKNTQKARKVFTVVYDCGATPQKNVNAQIKKTFSKDSVVDILFISHFDADHINGLTKLKDLNIKIRYLVVPLLKNTQKLVAFLETGINFFSEEAIRNYFENVENIIFINPISDNSPNQHFSNANDNIPTESLRLDSPPLGNTNIKSGTNLLITANIPWVFKPFNVCNEDEYAAFYSQLSQSYKGLAEKLDGIYSDNNKDFISLIEEDAIKKLKEIYKQYSGNDRNKTSVIVYSGPYKPGAWEKNYRIIPTDSLIGNYLDNNSSGVEEINGDFHVGALYTGDIDFNLNVVDSEGNTQKAYDFIRQKLKSFERFIGLVQIPHHGSRHNFNSAITNFFPSAIYFYSVGKKNRYRHPFQGIKLWLLASGKKFYEITEKPGSKFMQLIKIK